MQRRQNMPRPQEATFPDDPRLERFSRRVYEQIGRRIMTEEDVRAIVLAMKAEGLIT